MTRLARHALIEAHLNKVVGADKEMFCRLLWRLNGALSAQSSSGKKQS